MQVHNSKSAYTLLEVIIAVAVFMALITVVMESMVAMRSYVAYDEADYSLELEARRVMRLISKDLNTSAWYIPMDPDEKFDLLDPAFDRDVRYYPYINVQSASGRGSLFSHFDRPADEVVAAADFPDQYPVPSNHRLPSQELIFLKISRGFTGDDPRFLSIPRVNYDMTPTVPFGRFWEGDVVSNMKLNLAGDTVIDVGLYFETDTSDRLREYAYIVRPDPQTRFRELVKVYAHRNDNGQTASTATVEDMQVVSRYVDRIVFDNYRTHAGLDVDQLRVEIYFSRRNESGNFNHLKSSMTVAMRSTVDPQYSEHIDSWLGTGGNYPVE